MSYAEEADEFWGLSLFRQAPPWALRLKEPGWAVTDRGPRLSFQSFLERDDVEFLFYVVVSGLPYIFGSDAQPARWTDLGPYTWSGSFIHSRDGGGGSTSELLSRKFDFERGISISGSADLEFGCQWDDPDDVWLGLLAPSDVRTWHINPEVLVAPSHQILSLVDNDEITVGQTLHIGNEAILVREEHGTQVLVAERGYLASVPGWLGTRGNPAASGFGNLVEITSHPRSWKGRIVSVWCAPCRAVNGVLRPYSNSPMGEYDEELFRGLVDDRPRWNAAEPVVTLPCLSIDEWLDRPVIQRPRRYFPGPPTREAAGWVYVENGGPSIFEYDCGSQMADRLAVADPDVELLASSQAINLCAAGEAFEGGKLVNSSELAGAICAALNARTRTATDTGILWSFSEGFNDEGKSIMRFHSVYQVNGTVGDPTAEPCTFRVKTGTYDRDLQVLYALGATDDVVITSGVRTSAEDVTHIEVSAPAEWATGVCQEPIPFYTVFPTNSWIYWHV